ncbi:glycosyltransferase [Paenibacillus lemnae]|uniref:glycosyltransferase n=1 Tax=Paenibacillus lemnae TaxID=1330551 RepID=UPI0031B5D3D4
MKKKEWLAMLLCGALIVGMTQAVMPVSVHAKMDEIKKADGLSPAMVQLKADMQRAWIDHTIWTRSYIVSALSNLPDQKDVLARLLKNQQDIGDVIKPYYGEAAGSKLTALLKEHILIAGKIVAAAKEGHSSDVKKLEAEWHKNADDIAKFLSGANPNWDFKELQDMLYTHLQLITEIVLDRIKGDWTADIAATDKNEIHMIHLADILTEGMVKQFPEKF